MPYVAQNTDDEELTMVEAADPLANFGCPDCGATVAYVREHHRENTHGTVSAHFRYGSCGCAGVKKTNSTMTTSGSGGSGESQLHKERKWTALQAALNRYEHSSYELEKKIGDKRADAVLEFAEPHSEYGRGLVIEYQHKNEGKDIVGTERHFARHEYTTLWIWEDQFNSLDGVPDVDLFDGRVCTPWPYAVPKRNTWTGTHKLTLPRELQKLQTLSVPATFPRHWFRPTPHEYWKQKGWSDGFRDAKSYEHERMMLEGMISTLPTSERPAATIPEPAADEIVYRSEAWHRERVVERPPRLVFSPTLPFAVVDEWVPQNRKDESLDIEPPWGPFDDVQCHNCEHYQYAPSAGMHCPTCGKLYDWQWNVQTGRIDRSSIPEVTSDSVTNIPADSD